MNVENNHSSRCFAGRKENETCESREMRRTFFAAFVAALPAQSFIMSCPDISFATSKDFQEVYEPDSDSWLLMDSLSVETDLLRSLSPSICLEIGVGSGAVLTHLATLLGPSAALYLGVDINPHATRLAQRTGKHNGVSLELVQTSLMDGLLPRLRNVVDVLLFNPPYVPTPSEELVGLGIQRSWAGGARGREILDRLLPFISVRSFLSLSSSCCFSNST